MFNETTTTTTKRSLVFMTTKKSFLQGEKKNSLSDFSVSLGDEN